MPKDKRFNQIKHLQFLFHKKIKISFQKEVIQYFSQAIPSGSIASFQKDIFENIDWSIIENQKSERTLWVIIGGDGLMHRFLNQYFNKMSPTNKPKVFIIPQGTGNDFAKSLNITNKNWKYCLDNAECKPVITGEVIGKKNKNDSQKHITYFNNIASMGLTAEVVHSGEWLKNSLGSLGYLLGGAKALLTYRGQEVSYNQKNYFNTTVVAVGIGQYFGDGLKICPQANFGKQIGLTLVSEFNLKDLVFHFKGLKNGDEMNKITKFQAESIPLKFTKPMGLETDGEFKGYYTEFTFTKSREFDVFGF